MLWKLEPQPKGKPKKAPYIISDYKASSTNPETWSSFDKAFEIYLVALQGLLEMGEFSYHKTIEEVERMYRLKSNSVAAFADECVKMSSDDTSKAVFYETYVMWCKKSDEKPESNAIFGKKFRKLGYESLKASTPDLSGKRGYFWEGISLVSM